MLEGRKSASEPTDMATVGTATGAREEKAEFWGRKLYQFSQEGICLESYLIYSRTLF